MRWSPRKVLVSLVRNGVPGLRRVQAQVPRYAKAWEASNVLALAGSGSLWVVLGDSTAQGIGAPSHLDGYVGQVHRALEATTGASWRILNLSLSGGRARHVLDEQMPQLDSLANPPELVTCAVGANDVVRRTPPEKVEAEIRAIINGLPAGRSVVGTIPQGLSRERTAQLNVVIRSAAEDAGLVVADVHAHTGPPWAGKLAEDQFHPGALGYADWANAFAEALAVPPLPLSGSRPSI